MYNTDEQRESIYEGRRDKNLVLLAGELEKDTKSCPSFEGKNGITVYKNTLAVPRTSGTLDHIPVAFPIYNNDDFRKLTEGQYVSVEGFFRGLCDKIDDGNGGLKNKMNIYTLVKQFSTKYNLSLEVLDGYDTNNYVLLDGDICSDVIKRHTTSGTLIADFLLRNIRKDHTSDKIKYNVAPCIAWRELAHYFPTERYTYGEVTGRFQSRDYINGKGEEGRALEISIHHFNERPNPTSLVLKRK